MSDPVFSVGDYVEKRGGDYVYQGWIVAAFTKRSGKTTRYVVENVDGMLFIFNSSQLVKP